MAVNRRQEEPGDTESSQIRERAEAIHAADIAIEHMERALEKLNSASNWGLFDMFAGGMITSMIKHRRIDDAEDEFNAARDAVRAFARELSDVNDPELLRFDIGGFASGMDIFFDNVFADIYVQHKIERARDRVRAAIEQVGAIRAQLMRF
ncbi:hypothetical protein [Collinsella vaginalis]|uniref:hypothetical protein n=1 Tax=Collinsella vaginalis TaxID=1870987 RepID=UPI000A26DD17|nr:hypothetical protein [Collinsella vaginalis]